MNGNARRHDSLRLFVVSMAKNKMPIVLVIFRNVNDIIHLAFRHILNIAFQILHLAIVLHSTF